jgi:hypothetical protein
MRSSTSAKPGGLTNERRAGSIRAASRGHPGENRRLLTTSHLGVVTASGLRCTTPTKARVADAGSSLQAAANFGKGIGMSLTVILWVVVDFLVAVPYGLTGRRVVLVPIHDALAWRVDER